MMSGKVTAGKMIYGQMMKCHVGDQNASSHDLFTFETLGGGSFCFISSVQQQSEFENFTNLLPVLSQSTAITNYHTRVPKSTKIINHIGFYHKKTKCNFL